MKVQFTATSTTIGTPSLTTVINGDSYTVKIRSQVKKIDENRYQNINGWMWEIAINGQDMIEKAHFSETHGQVANTKKACIEVATKALSDLTQVDVIANSKPLVKIVKA